jgi:hypothetical protein
MAISYNRAARRVTRFDPQTARADGGRGLWHRLRLGAFSLLDGPRDVAA